MIPIMLLMLDFARLFLLSRNLEETELMLSFRRGKSKGRKRFWYSQLLRDKRGLYSGGRPLLSNVQKWETTQRERERERERDSAEGSCFQKNGSFAILVFFGLILGDTVHNTNARVFLLQNYDKIFMLPFFLSGFSINNSNIRSTVLFWC